MAILSDCNDQTDIVAGTQDDDPGELVSYISMQVDPQLTTLSSGTSICSAMVPIRFRPMATVRSPTASMALGPRQEMASSAELALNNGRS